MYDVTEDNDNDVHYLNDDDIGIHVNIKNKPHIHATYQGKSRSGKKIRVLIHAGYIHQYMAYIKPENITITER